MLEQQYKAVISSDWSECLSPNGPFDPISFCYPQLKEELQTVFRQYTGNSITLTEATARICELIPSSFTEDQMDSFLESSFRTYTGVPELIQWCLDNNILFVLNTTGSQGYFQRVFAKKLLPKAPVVAANPFIVFPHGQDDPLFPCQVLEIEDKPKCTRTVLELARLDPSRLVVMGDSGGDGPHFHWASEAGAFTVGSMTKSSLAAYCESRNARIGLKFGAMYGPNEPRDVEREMTFDFRDLIGHLERLPGFKD